MAIVTRIAAVSYLNTIPFIYGIEHEGSLRADLLLAPPAECVENFINHKADIALLPVAAIPALKDAEIITDYCIGASSAVRSVVIVSNDPIEEIKRLYLDPHSRTSVQLGQYLLKNKWKVSPEIVPLDDYELLDAPLPGDAFLIIGDKVFDYEDSYIFSYDLAEEWIEHTSLPFVFAAWVARKGCDPQHIEALENALTFGIEHTYEAILEHKFDSRDYAYTYLTENIDYIFDNQKHQALHKFWDSGLKSSPRVNPG